LNPATLIAEIEKAQAEAAASEAANDEVVPMPRAATETPAAEAKAQPEAATPQAEADTPQPEAAPAAPIQPIRFTIRNEILHGPMLWPASLGIARVNTKFDLGPEIRQKIVEVFGTDEPVRISTRVGFFGGATTRLYGDGRTIKLKDDDGTFKYDDYELDIRYSGKLDDVDLDGSWPRVEFEDAKDGGKVVIEDATLWSTNERIQGDLYDTDFKVRIDEIRVIGADKSETVVENVHYLVDTTVDGEFVSVGAKFGSGSLQNQALKDLALDVQEVHYDFSVRRLHTETLAKLSTEFKAMYGKPVVTLADVDAVMMAPLKQYGAELLKYDPEFGIDRIGIKTADGDGYLKGVVRLKGVTAQDFDLGFMPLIAKLEADIHIEVAQKLIDKLPSGATSAGAAVDGGYARRDGDKLVSHIEFKAGELKINGKAQGIPPLGGPPGAAEGMPPEGDVLPMPQE
jgi:uncharacterized protein YdgA (DUF945 family)